MYFNPQPKGDVKKVKVIKGLRKMVANIAPVVANKEETVANAPDLVANSKHGIYADKEKRKKYQRELMRKRRLSAKSKESDK